MIIYINDKPVRVVQKAKIEHWDQYHTIKKGNNKMISDLDLQGDILFVDLESNELKVFLLLMHDKKFSKANSITFAVNKYKKAKKLIKNQFEIVEAAGGLVRKDDAYLMIYRLKKWDLPKGKAEKNEKPKLTAVREVEEECNVKVKLVDKICVTWHTYTRNEKRVLKKTMWYLMDIEDDAKMKPQKEENIDKVEWVEEKELMAKLENTYPSIIRVFRKFKSKFHQKLRLT